MATKNLRFGSALPISMTVSDAPLREWIDAQKRDGDSSVRGYPPHPSTMHGTWKKPAHRCAT